MQSEPFRMTKQRQILLDEIRKLKNHPTADDLYQIVRRKLPRISLGTVYRNLEVLSQSGMIQKLDVGGTQKRFDGNADNHYHVRCVQCSRIDDLDLPPDQNIESRARERSAFVILRHSIEFLGLCPKCQAQQQAPITTT